VVAEPYLPTSPARADVEFAEYVLEKAAFRLGDVFGLQASFD
jgi:hypothetical protein